MAVHIFNPADWRHHNTNGLTCWCNPEVRTVNRLTGAEYAEPHVFHGACVDPEPEPEPDVPAPTEPASEGETVTPLQEGLRYDDAGNPYPAPAAEPEPEVPLPQTANDAIALTMGSPLMHFACFEKIENKQGQLEEGPKPTEFQIGVEQAYEWCIANEVPVRIIELKPRQSGGSTITCEICYHHSRRFRCNGLLMADEDDRTDKIWAMLNRFADCDQFAGYWGTTWAYNTEIAKQLWKEADGTDRSAVWERETANDSKAGAAGTRRILWFSEAARYKKTGEAADFKVIGNAINSMPYEADTVVFLESTAEGPTGYFADVYASAVTLKERMAGKVGNGWIKVFCAWHECADYRLLNVPNNAPWFDDEDPRFARFNPREEAGRIRWKWTPEQVAWRRMKIVSELAGDERLFDRDFPDSEEAAFAASGNSALDAEGLAVLRKNAVNVEPLMGRLIAHSPIRIVFQPTVREQADFLFWEQPQIGLRYLVTVDPMSGKSDVTGAGEKDRHAVFVLRDAYLDAFGKWHPLKVVARVTPPNQFDDKVIAMHIALLAKYYGNCTIVVEGNYGGGIIEELRDQYQANLMKRPVFNRTTQRTEERLGWWTDKTSKRVMVGHLQDHVREQKIEIFCMHTIAEFATLIVDNDGRVKASGKNQDDDPMAVAQGLACIGAATKYTEPKVPRPKAPDHRRWKPVNSWT